MTKTVPDDTVAGADRRWSALMAAAQAGDGAAYQAKQAGGDRACAASAESAAEGQGPVRSAPAASG